MIIGDGIILGAGGESASIFVTGLSETDNVSATHKIPEKVPNPAWHGLPDGYTELEYIQSSGTQYIDTVYKPKTTTTVKTRFYISPHASYDCPFGCRTTSTSNAFLLFTRQDGTAKSTFNHGNSENWIATDNMYNKWLDISTDASHLYMRENNNLLYTLTFNGTTQDTQYNLFLFNLNQSGSVYPNNICDTNCKMSYFQAYENDTLVRNLIPCKRNSDSSVGMYDLISSTFFENAGTGTFTAGAEVPQYIDGYVDGKTIIGKWIQKPNPTYVVPDGYTQLEYIQSSGTQCFDTGIKASSNVGVEIDYFDFTTNGTNENILFGGSNGSWDAQLGMNNQLGYGKTYAYYGYDGNTGLPIETACKYKLENGVLYKNGEQVYSNAFSAFSYNYNIYLLAQNWAGTIRNHIKLKLKSFKMWESKALVRDFIPAKRKTDSTVGLYDLVNDVFYTNAGTGTFIAGPEVPQYIDGFLIDKINSYGTWTVEASNGSDQETANVLVDAVETYSVYMQFFDYGDGSNNTVVSGYSGKVYLNGSLADEITPKGNSGNFHDGTQASGLSNSLYAVMSAKKTGGTSYAKFTAGLAEYSFIIDASNEQLSVLHHISSGDYSPNTIGGLMYKVDENYYTLHQMVEANIVKPLIILASCANNGGYYFPNVLNVYSGGSSDSGNYPSLLVYFMLNSGHKITGAKWSMANGGGGDINFGWNVSYAPVSEFRMTLS